MTTAASYDLRGNLMKLRKPTGLVTKTTYDGAGRASVVYQTDGTSDSTWANAASVSDDNVLSQTQYMYDANGNVILITTKDRFHDETNTGALVDKSSTPKARVSYNELYYDAADRLTAVVDIGTNGGSWFTRDSSVPAASDTKLVTGYGYDAAGQMDVVTDPKAVETHYMYDALGRITATIEGYVNGTMETSDGRQDDDRTTGYTYDGSDHVLTLKADLPGTAYQQTQYVYGVTTTGGSGVNSNDLLAEVRYPDKTSGAASTSEKETLKYNALGEVTSYADRNGTTHSYRYDYVGRFHTDDVTGHVGTGVDSGVTKLGYSYDSAGRLFDATSYDATNNTVNQVERYYNGFGQLSSEYQEHDGAVATSTTPQVDYAYDDASGPVTGRITSMTYPDGRVLHYAYASGVDASISRLTSLVDDNGTTHLEDESYLGLNTIVKRAHPETGIDLTYAKISGESDNDGTGTGGGDQYTGLDRFGRITDQRWTNSGGTSTTDRFQYGYDRDGNVLYKDNLVNSAYSELYHSNTGGNGYDQLNRLTDFQRGTLTSTKDQISGTALRAQGWSLDALGNWSGLTQSGGGSNETRMHNKQNELTQINTTNLSFDNNGNTTDDGTNGYTYDAWNRIASTFVQGRNWGYAYDALGRRIVEGSSPGDGIPTPPDTHLYYTDRWQVIEEHSVAGLYPNQTTTTVQNVWSPVYVDALVLRDVTIQTGIGSDGPTGGQTESIDPGAARPIPTIAGRLYAQQDANWNVTAITNTSGAVQERFIYDPYGKVSYRNADWSAAVGDTYTFSYLHQGGRLDQVSRLYQFRNRDQSTALGRWMQEDPAGYIDGSSVYGDELQNPVAGVDPLGLHWVPPHPWTPIMSPPRVPGQPPAPPLKWPGLDSSWPRVSTGAITQAATSPSTTQGSGWYSPTNQGPIPDNLVAQLGSPTTTASQRDAAQNEVAQYSNQAIRDALANPNLNPEQQQRLLKALFMRFWDPHPDDENWMAAFSDWVDLIDDGVVHVTKDNVRRLWSNYMSDPRPSVTEQFFKWRLGEWEPEYEEE